jgi:chloride channel 3/4/5
MSSFALEEEGGSSSSTSRSPNANALHLDSGDNDELDLGAVLDNDPLDPQLSSPMSFKRRQKPVILSSPARIFSSLTGRRQSPLRSPTRAYGSPHVSGTSTPTRLQGLHRAGQEGVGGYGEGQNASSAKDGVPLDWYVEGPGRRVGYEDLTAIDWIFEYTKERQRLRVLYSSASGIIGYVQQLLDASQAWVILVSTGLAVGALAAAIDVTTDWLGDFKTGYCSSGPDGGAFYLSKTFCCLGYDQGAECAGWRPWAAALGIGSVGGKWAIEYLFFVLLSVPLALCSGFLVKEYAIYAKHSGIPEIKTVLGGFIIQGFLSTWTLVTKSLGLVCLLSIILVKRCSTHN